MHNSTNHIALTLKPGKHWIGLCLGWTLVLVPSALYGQSSDPPTFSSVAKWTFNDDPSDGTVDDTAINGSSDGMIGGTLGTDVIWSTDSPTGGGHSLHFDGQNGYLDGGSGSGDFFTSNESHPFLPGSQEGNFKAYTGSRSISVWVNIADTLMTQDVVVFYHGRPPRGYGEMTCGPDIDGTSDTAACTGFQLAIHGVDSPADGDFDQGFIEFGSTHGGSFRLTDTNSMCDPSTNAVDVVDGSWHHITGIYSKDLTDLGASYNTIIYIDGEECGRGLIPTPYTHVGGPDNPGSANNTDSRWMVSAYMYSSYGNWYGAWIAADKRVPGLIDDVRVYDRTLSPVAVNWLVTNSGQ